MPMSTDRQLSKVAVLLLSSLVLYTSAGSSIMTAALAPLSGSDSSNTIADISSHARAQYDALAKVLPGQVLLPSDATYQTSRTSYFFKQEEEISPGCIVRPLNTNDVATAIKALASVYESSHGSAKFAVRGGGHTPWAGSASIQGGAVVDMTSMKAVTVNTDRTVTSVEGGAKWSDVYSYLESKNLAVSGGRAAQVGVGGLTLGGGLSYFSARKGFVCDNVANYEIVLANGTVIDANQSSNPDLWIALRGGSNNFGVVTRFDLETFEQGSFWGGVIYYPITTASQQLAAFYDFAKSPNYDDYSAIIQSFGFSGGRGSAAVNGLYYTKPQANPPALQGFTAIEPQLASTMRIDSLLNLTVERGATSPDGLRELYITTTFKNDLSLLHAVYENFSNTIGQVEKIAGITWALTFQPIVPAITTKSASRGGNSQGLSGSEGPLVNALLTTSWTLSSDDELINRVAARFIQEVDALAQAKGLFNRFVYLNYANKTQSPIDGYGAASKANLQAVSRKYDSKGLFQSGVPGGFKLFIQ